MFAGFQRRWFASQVAAELRAQVGSQRIVNEILSTTGAGDVVEAVRTSSTYLTVAGPQLLPFLAACEALALTMDRTELPRSDRLMAAQFLSTRLSQADELVGPVLDTLRQRQEAFWTAPIE